MARNRKYVVSLQKDVCHENQTAVVVSWLATSKEMVVGPPNSVNKYWLQTTSCCCVMGDCQVRVRERGG